MSDATPPRSRPIASMAAVAFGLVATASYAIQRLIAAVRGGPDFGEIVLQVHVPYYWRCDLAAIHGILAATMVATLLGRDQAERWLARTPWLVLAVAGSSIVAMVLVP